MERWVRSHTNQNFTEVDSDIFFQETRPKPTIGAIAMSDNVLSVSGNMFERREVQLQFWFVTWRGEEVAL